MRKPLITAAAAIALAALGVIPATAGTTTTMTVTGVTITEPAAATPIVASGSTVSFSLGATVVTDIGGAGYTVSIAAGLFDNATVEGADVEASKFTACIPDAGDGTADVTLTADALTSDEGFPAITSAAVCAASDTGTLDTARPLLMVDGGNGTTELAEYDPTIKVDLSNASPGVYTGTITQTVS